MAPEQEISAMTERPRSQALYTASCERIPGGVNSPVRAFRGVGGTPVFIDRGEGPWVFDVDGNAYVDYVLSWGPLILGHAHPVVVDAVRGQALRGTSYGAPTAGELEMAELLCEAVPSLDLVRLVNSGTEATMSAIRLARGFTGRSAIVKFEGCYHGHVDALLTKAGSGVATIGIAGTPGVPAEVVRETLTVPYNDVAGLSAVFESHGERIAAVIVEPVAGNMGCVRPRAGFLEAIREHCDKSGALLIFDEVMTGFRVAWGGAQSRFGIRPDLTALGKVIGGGLPVGAYGGRADIMRKIAPDGPVYQAGTLSGNPLAVAAGLATLRILQADDGVYERLEALAHSLVDGLVERATVHGIGLSGQVAGAMFGFAFTPDTVTDYAGAKAADTKAHATFFHGMLDRGIYFAPSAFEAAFVSTAHTQADIARTLRKAEEVFAEMG
jgi:glutamate-1-semialdehyde 2,1-aminomutase